MKTTLTIEQSAELIKRGVSSDKASKRVTRQVADSRGREIEKLRLKRWKDCVPYEKATMTNLHVGLMRFEHKEIFTLADLLSLLPKEIEKTKKHRLWYAKRYDPMCGTTKWDTVSEYTMRSISDILDRHDQMIRQEIDDEIAKITKQIEEL